MLMPRLNFLVRKRDYQQFSFVYRQVEDQLDKLEVTCGHHVEFQAVVGFTSKSCIYPNSSRLPG